MRALIDFMNLVHPWLGGVGTDLPFPPDDLPGQINLLGTILSANGFGDAGTVIVCDGAMPKGVSGNPASGVAIRFAGPGREADALIEELIEADTGPRHLLVVSSDRRILRAAQRRRAHIATSEAFLRRLKNVPDNNDDDGPGEGGNSPRRNAPLSEEEVESWLTEFGISQESDTES